MVPEMESKSEKPVVSQVRKEKMVVASVESGVTRDVDGDGCTASQACDVIDKKRVRGSDVENPEINVTDSVNPREGADGDATEDPSGNSSSFDDTFSGVDGLLGLSDDEINSEFRGVGQSPWAYLGYEEAFRTRFIHLSFVCINLNHPISVILVMENYILIIVFMIKKLIIYSQSYILFSCFFFFRLLT